MRFRGEVSFSTWVEVSVRHLLLVLRRICGHEGDLRVAFGFVVDKAIYFGCIWDFNLVRGCVSSVSEGSCNHTDHYSRGCLVLVRQQLLQCCLRMEWPVSNIRWDHGLCGSGSLWSLEKKEEARNRTVLNTWRLDSSSMV